MADEFNISDQPEQAGPKSVEVPGDIADGTAGELLTWDAAGVATLVAVGTATHVLTSNGPGTEPTFQAVAGGVTTFLGLTDTPGTYAAQSGHPVRVNNLANALEFVNVTDLNRFTANDAIFPASAPAGTRNRNDHALITFDDTVDESILFESVLNEWYNVNESIQVTLMWTSATAIVGAVRWVVQFENLGDGGQDLDVDGFAAGVTSTPTAPGTAGVLRYSNFSNTNAQADSILPGNTFRLRVTRTATNAADTMIGDAELLAVHLKMI